MMAHLVTTEDWIEAHKEEWKQEGISIGEKRGISIGEKRGISIGKQEGISIGEKRGKIEERKFIINNMLQSGISKEIIATSVGISQKELDDFLTNDKTGTK